MAQSGNCVGNMIMWVIGYIITGIWLPFGNLVSIFGLWQLGVDVEASILQGFAPPAFLEDGGAVELYEEPWAGVTPCEDMETCQW